MGLMLAVGLCCWRVSAWLREMENVRCLPTLRLARAPSFSISTNSLSTHDFEWSHTIHPDPDDIASKKRLRYACHVLPPALKVQKKQESLSSTI